MKTKSTFNKDNENFILSRIIYDQDNNLADLLLVEIGEGILSKLDLSREEIIYKKISQLDIIPKKDRKRWIEFFKEIERSGEKGKYTGRLTIKDIPFYAYCSIPFKGYIALNLIWKEDVRVKGLNKYGINFLIEADSVRDNNIWQTLFEHSPFSIIIYRVKNSGKEDEDFIVKNANPNCLQMEGWELSGVLGRPIIELRPGIGEFGLLDVIKEVYKTGESRIHPAKLYNEEGVSAWFENTVFMLSENEVVVVYTDVTESKEKEERIQYLSNRDQLTGLYNRSYLEKIFLELDQNESYPLTIIMGDLDGLKLFNDIYGHEIGNRALCKVAEAFLQYCPEDELIARWGGDEFVAIIKNAEEKLLIEMVSRIENEVRGFKIQDMPIGISLGYSSKESKEEKIREVLKRAEDNMYLRKLLGARSYKSAVLTSIRASLFEKSNETEEHGERMAVLGKVIGKTMGLSSQKIDELELLAYLHDMGKIAIDENILSKEGPLTEEEWEIIKRHPETAYRMAMSIPDLVPIAESILSHHEKWDGSGYPRGLKGEGIPLLARIMSVVDAYDAMTNDRPYKKAIQRNEAIKELEHCAGSQFDPDIVKIISAFLKEKPN